MKNALLALMLALAFPCFAFTDADSGQSAAAQRSVDPNPSAPNDYWQWETPGQVTGLVATELAMGMGVGYLGAMFGAKLSMQECHDQEDEDYTKDCSFGGLPGALLGLAIGLPLGQGLGVIFAGALEGKHGSPGFTLASAYAGDAITLLALTSLYNAMNGHALNNGGSGIFFVGLGAAAMLAIPVATYTYGDYHARLAIEPNISLGPDRESTRIGARLVEVRF
jgi:hypothetical protein